MRESLLRLLRLQDTTAAERQATLWTGAFFFCVLASYYLLRPLREEIGTAFGGEQLIGLFGLTFAFITVLNVPYMALCNRLPTARLLPFVLHGFAASFLAFGVLFELVPAIDPKGVAWSSPQGVVGMSFYSWVSAFVVCGVTLVWVHAVDHFSTQQGKRLFGLVSVGGTLGAIFGSSVVLKTAEVPRQVLIVLAAVLLEVALWCYVRSARACARMVAEHGKRPDPRRIAHAGFWHGFALLLRSRYIAGIACFVLLSSIIATLFYYQLTGLAKAQLPDSAERRGLFATINLVQNLLALVIQTMLTGRTLLRLGLAAVLCVMPAASMFGLGALALLPTVAMVAAVDVLRRTMQFAFDKPAREVLYTPLGLEAKYKSKAFIDTTVLRLGDLLGSVLNHQVLAVGLHTLAFAAAPVLAVWGALGAWLGRQCQRQQAASDAAAATVANSVDDDVAVRPG